MTRFLLNLLAAASLLLCVAAGALWVSSYRFYDAVGFWPSPAIQKATIYLTHLVTGCVHFVASAVNWKQQSSGGDRTQDEAEKAQPEEMPQGACGADKLKQCAVNEPQTPCSEEQRNDHAHEPPQRRVLSPLWR